MESEQIQLEILAGELYRIRLALTAGVLGHQIERELSRVSVNRGLVRELGSWHAKTLAKLLED